MSALRLRLPESLHEALREAAVKDGTSINQLIVTAVAEKLSALRTEDYLEQRAKRGSREGFLAALAKVPDIQAVAGDEL